MSVAIYYILAIICFLSAGYFFLWAATNFWEGLTFEAVALSVVLALAGITFILAANHNKQKRR